MAQINISHLTFAYDGSYDNVFDDLSIDFDTDWRLGLVGRNGRGKTTLLRLLLGQYDFRGNISCPAECTYFPVEVRGHGLTALEAALQAAPQLEQWRLERALGELRLDSAVLERSWETLSSGERTKVLLAALFQQDGGFPLIDEPTNHLDAEGRKVLAQFLRRQKGFVLVSHDRAFLDGCVSHILALNRLGVEVQRGDFSSWWENRRRQDAFEQTENERLQKDIRRLSEAARRTSTWSDQVEKTKKGQRNAGLRPDRGYIGHKSAKMMKRSKAIEERREDAIRQKSSLLKNVEKTETLKLSPLEWRRGRILEARGLSLHYGGRPVCGGLDFEVLPGERIAVRGANGSGKSTLLKLCLGEEIEHTGRFEKGTGLVLSYVPQDAGFLRGSLRDFAARSAIDESLFKAILRKLDFARVQFEKDMSDLSAGQKKKVLLARSLCQQAHLYIWDEPLNYIDVFSRMQLEELLLEYQPTMLFVEHDAMFCQKIADKSIEL